ncbi:MAG TPA: serine/threonine-protein kinase [Planctomycetota bacterium]
MKRSDSFEWSRSRPPRGLRARQLLGDKYRVERRIDRGGFADVYRARDIVEGIPVALKVPHAHLVDRETLETFRKEARLVARLDHPGVLPLKTANFIDGHFVIVYPLGDCNLATRMTKRLATRTALDYCEQLLEALAYAHEQRIVHCDVKPENILLFPDNRLRLTDFGIAKIAFRTLRAAGTGTVGYVAPEQAMGRPSFRSDVFSAGLVMYRLHAGQLPEWPFEWPFAGHERLKRRLHPDAIAMLRRSLALDPRDRYRDAGHFLKAFRRLRQRGRLLAAPATPVKRVAADPAADWKQVRVRQFRSQFGAKLEARHQCIACKGPVAESMAYCPWCRAERRTHPEGTRFPAACGRCKRGVKLDWRFCPWCYGAGIGPLSDRSFTDKRYTATCSRGECGRDLMPWMRYCPWCRTKVSRKWRIEGTTQRCTRCQWGTLHDFWNGCPWCGHKQPAHSDKH